MTHRSFGQLTICLIFGQKIMKIFYNRYLVLSSNTSKKAHDLRA